MENPAEETTVRPNQNQNRTAGTGSTRSRSQLLLPEKEPQLFPHQTRINRAATIQSNRDLRSPFFANQLVIIAMHNPAASD
jgi:hypothetical protein